MTHIKPQLPSFEDLLSASAATEAFKNDARAFAASQKSSPRVAFAPGNPPVKVQRVLMQLLEQHPGLAIDSVEVSGRSGCSDYRGTATVEAAGKVEQFQFVWDCAWKASKEGLKTFWGDPDQQKAARLYGYRCFERFDRVTA